MQSIWGEVAIYKFNLHTRYKILCGKWEEYGNVRVVKTGSYSIHDDGNKVIEDENGNEIVVNGNEIVD